MDLNPTYYLADFMTGDLLEPLPVGVVREVSLESSQRPGQFQATVDLQAAGFTQAQARAWVDELRFGRCTLVPIREGVTNGNSITSVGMGEWWICAARGTYRGHEVVISGPEWDGYAQSVLVAEAIKGTVDPVVTTRQLLGQLYSTSQSVVVDLQEWISHTGARIPVDIRQVTRDYWAEIADLQDAEDGPFEWRTRTGLVLDGWVPRRVTRTLEVGQPRLWFDRPGIVLEVTGPGKTPGSLLDADWGWDKRAYPSTVYGYGDGSGDDQRGPRYLSRSRVAGEPAVNAMITRPDALTDAELDRYIRAALNRLTPQEIAFGGVLPVDRYTPRTGEVYGFKADAGWTQPKKDSQVQCAGWTWQSSAPDRYALDLVEV